MTEYYLAHQGNTTGPYSLPELKAKIETGEALEDDLVWRAGMTDWRKASEVLLKPGPPPLPVFQSQGLYLPSGVTAVPARKHRVWPWVVGGVALLLLVLGAPGVTIYFLMKGVAAQGSDTVSQKKLFEERAEHPTQWRKSSYESDGPAERPPKGVFELTHYPSPAGQLAAYVTPDPKDGKKHPAMVWAHGGFGGIGDFLWRSPSKHNDQSARAFREAGMVLMCPSWRGENDNPGRFELFFGEVEDMIAAIEWVKKLPYVDPDRVYIGGHSTGGTMTLLTSVGSDKFRAAFSFGGMPDAVKVLSRREGYGNTPYDPDDVVESRLRSPTRYTAQIKKPTFYFEGRSSAYISAARRMEQRALQLHVPFEAFALPGDHFDLLHPITHLIAKKILADTTPDCHIQFTAEELGGAYREAFVKTLGNTLQTWLVKGGDLKKTLGGLDQDDAVLRNKDDLTSLSRTLVKMMAAPPTPENAGLITQLLEMGTTSDDEELTAEFKAKSLPAVLTWARGKMTKGLVKEDETPFLDLLSALASAQDAKATDLVIAAAYQGIAPDNYRWNSILGTYDKDHPDTARLMATFAKKLPPPEIAAALLDAASELRQDKASSTHPFDSPAGAELLRAWLSSKDQAATGEAQSAAAALAYLSPDIRRNLLPLALTHAAPAVQMQAAWVDSKTGGNQGSPLLQKACLDVNQSEVAQNYLRSLGRQNEVPFAAKEPAFKARANLSNWLQFPNELGAVPLTLEVYDHRELYWPPLRAKRQVWLLRFTYQFKNDAQPKTGYGMTGTMTWASFIEYATAPKPEDLYVHHCKLEFAQRTVANKDAPPAELNESEVLEALKKGNPGFGEH